MSAIHLNSLDLLVSTVLVLMTGGISLALRLELEKKLALAAARTVVQLLLIGYLLRFVFQINSPWLLFLVLFAMIAVAAHTAVGRLSRTLRGAQGYALFSLTVTALVITFTVTSVVINVDPWFQPRYVIPLMGMVLGNAMTSISLCLDRLFEEYSLHRQEVEVDLALGATRWEAAQRPLRSAVRLGMIPMINSMMVAGIVSLPGMMTGQILAGQDPLEAVKYQIVVMFMISAATALGCILTAVIVYRRLFNEKHQLLAHLIQPRRKKR